MPIRRPDHGCHGYSSSRNSVCGRSQVLLYNTIRPHASLGFKPPAPEVFVPAFAAWPAALRRAAPPRTHQSYLDRDPVTVAAIELGGIRTLLVVPMIKNDVLM